MPLGSGKLDAAMISQILSKFNISYVFIELFTDTLGLQTLLDFKYANPQNVQLEDWLDANVWNLENSLAYGPVVTMMKNHTELPKIKEALQEILTFSKRIKEDSSNVEHIFKQIESKAQKRKINENRFVVKEDNLFDQAVAQAVDITAADQGKAMVLGGSFEGLTKKQKMQKIIETPELTELGSLCVLLDSLAVSTRASYSSEAKLYEKLCAAREIDPWPVTVKSITIFGGALKLAEYTAGSQYISAITKINQVKGHVMTFAVLQTKSMLQQSLRKAEKDNGVRHRRPLEVWQLKEFEKIVFSQKEEITACLYVVAFAWLMREKEILNLKVEDILFNSTLTECTIGLVDTKTDQGGTTNRTLHCICDQRKRKVPTCPVCAIAKLVQYAQETDQIRLRPPVITPSYFEDFIKTLLHRLDVQTTTPDGTQMYGTHSLRGGGALALSLGGMPLEVVKKFGRWESDAIHIYVLDAPILSMGRRIAQAFDLGKVAQAHMAIEDRKYSRNPIVGDGIRVWYQLPLEEEEELKGMWCEGLCVATDSLTFTINFENEMKNTTVDWKGCVRFNLVNGPSWYKI